jgi:hypothetical protein
MNKNIVYVGAIIVALITVGMVAADPSPTGSPGQPGAPGTTCGSPGVTAIPGSAGTAIGSPFNGAGIAGLNYAGNPDTASLAHSQSGKAISQYDVACFQVTQTHP